MFSCIITFPILWIAQFTHIRVTHADEDTWFTISMKEEWLVTHTLWYTRVAVREKWHFFLYSNESNRQQITNIRLTNVMQRQHTYIDLAFAPNPHDRQVIINIFTFKDYLSAWTHKHAIGYIQQYIKEGSGDEIPAWWWISHGCISGEIIQPNLVWWRSSIHSTI